MYQVPHENYTEILRVKCYFHQYGPKCFQLSFEDCICRLLLISTLCRIFDVIMLSDYSVLLAYVTC